MLRFPRFTPRTPSELPVSWSRSELDAALGTQYEIQRELGRGGMAVVFLARDLRHSRSVALKVMRPELASSVAADRFLREMSIAARLAHPHILPLLDSGDANGILYYAMPYIEGETLRQRLDRERQLAIGEALAIVRQVASALEYAHARGVIHRDVKPENVLLLGDDALVADFGLGRVLYSAGSSPITESGLAVGTPRYMSPEQGAGDRAVDGRADIYSLACVLFEMIAGIPPFQGATGQAIIAHHFRTPPPSVRRERESCPAAIDAAIQRAMAKVPADRFKTAEDFMRALDVAPRPRMPFARSARARRITLVAAGLVAVAAPVVWSRTRTTQTADEDLVAVVPFRVSVPDTALASLREGIVDLLHDRFPRVVSTATVLDAWKRATGGHDDIDLSPERKLAIAKGLGAGQLVAGSIVKVPRGIELRASLIGVRDGRPRASATAAGAPADFGALIDTVANKLLSLEAGEADRLYLLKSIPTSALQLYFEGKRSYRRGRYDEAARYFERALDSSRVGERESGFVFAAFGLVQASNYNRLRNETPERGLRIAWNARDRLNPRDRMFLVAQAGPTYPVQSMRRDQLKAWYQAMDSLSDRPEAYFEFADLVLQFSDQVEWPDAIDQARTSLESALRKDSTFVPAIQRLAELAAMTGDLTLAERLAARLPGGDSATDKGGYVRWRIAAARGDERRMAALRERFDNLADPSLRQIWLTAQLEGISTADAARALDIIARSAARADERETVDAARYLLLMNEGRPADAVSHLQKALNEDAALVPVVQAQIIRDQIFGDGDAASAAAAVARLTAAVRDAVENPAPTAADQAVEYVARCALEEWRLSRGVADSAATTLKRLTQIIPVIQPYRFGGNTVPVVGAEPLCPVIIEAWAAAVRSRDDVAGALDRLDRLMTHGPMEGDAAIGNLLIARLRVARGDTAGALHALRRRPYSSAGLFYLAPSLRDEGRLAEATGDRSGAIKAFTRYLALRNAPEPSLRHEAEDVRVALARLQTVAATGGRRPAARTR